MGQVFQLVDGHAGVGVDVLPHVGLGQAGPGDLVGVLRAEHQHDLGAGAQVVVAGDAHTAHVGRNSPQDLDARAHGALHHAVDAQDGGDGHRAGRRVVPKLDVPGLPGA